MDLLNSEGGYEHFLLGVKMYVITFLSTQEGGLVIFVPVSVLIAEDPGRMFILASFFLIVYGKLYW